MAVDLQRLLGGSGSLRRIQDRAGYPPKFAPISSRRVCAISINLLFELDQNLNDLSLRMGSIRCGGWGSNPRSPTTTGPKPVSFDHSDTPAWAGMHRINSFRVVNNLSCTHLRNRFTEF